MKLNSDRAVAKVFKNYPKEVKSKMEFLRKLVLETAEEIDEVKNLEETLKWGEPSYLTKKGSTLRMDYKLKLPDQYAMYFKCTSKLVPTFRTVYGDLFEYEKNRAIIFKIDDSVHVKELKECIRLTLMYHTLKHLPLLGLSAS